MSNARIKLTSTSPETLTDICNQIKSIADKAGIDVKGPIPMPTKRMKIPVRRSACGQGRELFETWEMRIHKRMFNLSANERALRLIMRLQIPKSVNMELEINE